MKRKHAIRKHAKSGKKVPFSGIKLLFAIVASVLIGSIGGLATSPNIPTWYAQLNKPVLNPPNWIFGPVWTLLYAMMGASVYLVARHGMQKKNVETAVSWFVAQFLLNTLWSFLFFGMRNPLAGLLCIIFLWGSIAKTIIECYRIEKRAGYLLIPYILWVTFASYLNFGIWILNR